MYEAIAAGGMATVHYGRLLGPVGFSRTVAIKRLHPQFAQDPEFVAMFLDEARLAGRVRHPNVVATLDVVAEENEIFLVMDYIHGESLSRVIREVATRGERVPLRIALRIASDVLQGLHAAHETRDESGVPLAIVHRDISPQNILLGVDGVSRLVDFGVAKASGQVQTTRDGQIKGKLGYMAPEQLRASKITRQTDIHAFAVVFWEMLVGKRLFLGESEAETVARVVEHRIPNVSELVPGIPAEVDAVLARGSAESLERRYATAREMCLALDACGPIAQSIEVADWVQAEARDLLVKRALVVGAIERRQESGTGGTASEWFAGLADASGPEGATGTRTALASPSSVRSSATASRVKSGGKLRRRAPPWFAPTAIVLAIAGAFVGPYVATRRVLRTAPEVDAPVRVAASAVVPLAAPPPETAKVASPSAATPEAASAAPSASSSAPVAIVAPPAVTRPRTGPEGRPAGTMPTAPRRVSRPTDSAKVFDSRE